MWEVKEYHWKLATASWRIWAATRYMIGNTLFCQPLKTNINQDWFFSTFYFVNFYKCRKRLVEIISFSILYKKIVIKDLKSLNQIQVKNQA